MLDNDLVLVENTISHTFTKVSQERRNSVRQQTVPTVTAAENRVLEIRHEMDPKKTKPYRHMVAITRTICDPTTGLALRKSTTHVVTTHDKSSTEAEIRENEELVASFLANDASCGVWHAGGS